MLYGQCWKIIQNNTVITKSSDFIQEFSETNKPRTLRKLYIIQKFISNPYFMR